MAKTLHKDDDEHYDRRQKGADETFCASCGAIIKKDAEICPKCGVRSELPRVSPAGSTRGVTTWIA